MLEVTEDTRTVGVVSFIRVENRKAKFRTKTKVKCFVFVGGWKNCLAGKVLTVQA